MSNKISLREPFRFDDDDDDDDDGDECEGKAKKASNPLAKRLFDSRTILVAKPVDRELMAGIVAQLLLLDAADPKAPIRMYINCPGGDADSGFGIYDCMKLVQAPIRTVCMGLAASAAIIVFLGGDKGHRYSTRHSRFLIHQPSSQAQGQASDLEITANEIMKTRDKYNSIIEAETGITAKKIVDDAHRDFWLSAEEAVIYKLASKIISSTKDLK